MWGNLVALCCDVSYHCCYFCGIYAAKTSHFMLHFSYKVVWPDTFVKHSILVIVSFTVCRHGLVSASIRPMSGFEWFTFWPTPLNSRSGPTELVDCRPDLLLIKFQDGLNMLISDYTSAVFHDQFSMSRVPDPVDRKWTTLCLRKSIPDFLDCNLKTSYQILIVFGTNISDTACHQMTIQFPTAPNVCFCN